MITIYGFGRVPDLVVGLTRDLRVTVLNLLVISRSPDTEMKPRLTQWIEMRLEAIDERLGEHAYIIDETFTVADVLVVTMLRMLGGLGIVEKFANVRAYLARCEQRPAWQKVLDAYEDRLHATRGAGRRGPSPSGSLTEVARTGGPSRPRSTARARRPARSCLACGR